MHLIGEFGKFLILLGLNLMSINLCQLSFGE